MLPTLTAPSVEIPRALLPTSVRRRQQKDVQDLRDALHEIFLASIAIMGRRRCHVWMRARRQSTGEGVLTINGKQYGVARVALWVYRGDALGLDLDDMTRRIERTGQCISAACCNPEHVKIVERGA